MFRRGILFTGKATQNTEIPEFDEREPLPIDKNGSGLPFVLKVEDVSEVVAYNLDDNTSKQVTALQTDGGRLFYNGNENLGLYCGTWVYIINILTGGVTNKQIFSQPFKELKRISNTPPPMIGAYSSGYSEGYD